MFYFTAIACIPTCENGIVSVGIKCVLLGEHSLHRTFTLCCMNVNRYWQSKSVFKQQHLQMLGIKFNK